MTYIKFKTANGTAIAAAQEAIDKQDLVSIRAPDAEDDGNAMDPLFWALAIAMNTSDVTHRREITFKDNGIPEAHRVAAFRELPLGDHKFPTLAAAECLINAWNNANPSQKLQPSVTVERELKIFERVSSTAKPVHLSFRDGRWYALAPRYLGLPGQTRPQVIAVPEGRRVAPARGPYNDGLAPLPPNVMFLYPKNATAEEMERRPILDVRKGLWGVSAMVVPPGAILKDERDSDDNNDI